MTELERALKHSFYVILFITLGLLLDLSGGTVNAHAKEEGKTPPELSKKSPKKLLRPEIKEITYKNGKVIGLKLKQRGDFWDSKLENSVRYRIYVEPKLQLQLSDNFYTDINIALGDTVGSVQSRFGDLRASSFLFVKDARFFFRKSTHERRHFYKASIGAINQRGFLGDNLGILVSARALLGLEQIYKFENKYKDEKSYGLDLRFFEGVPSSESKTLDFNEKENIPFYYNGKLSFFIKDMKKTFGYRVGLYGGIFDFSSLPSSVANESRLFGNTVQNTGAAAEFKYDYKGWYAGWNTILSFNQKWEFRPYVSVITNTEAPAGRNQGQIFGADFKYNDQSLYSLSFEPYAFFNESDASIASYNGSTAGHNNREGYGIKLALELPGKGLKLRLDYVFTDVLEEIKSQQVPYHYVGLRMEYKYEL